MELLIILLVAAYFGFVVGTLVEHERASKPGHYEYGWTAFDDDERQIPPPPSEE